MQVRDEVHVDGSRDGCGENAYSFDRCEVSVNGSTLEWVPLGHSLLKHPGFIWVNAGSHCVVPDAFEFSYFAVRGLLSGVKDATHP